MKRLLAYLLTFLSIIMLSACADKDEKTAVLFYEINEADATYLSDSLGFSYADGEKVYLLLKNAGLDGEIESVARYTDGVTGEVFYRIHAERSTLDIYFYADGSVKINSGKESFLFDAADASIGDADDADRHTDTTDVIDEADTDSDTSEKTDTAHTENTADKLEFILNTSSKKYHRPDCRGVATMSEGNKETVYVKSESELTAKGYTPCGICGGE